MSVPITCSCGKTVGVIDGLSRYRNRRECRTLGEHGEPKITVRKGFLVNSVLIEYEDGSTSAFLAHESPDSKWRRAVKRILLAAYVKISRKSVYLEDEKDWLFA